MNGEERRGGERTGRAGWGDGEQGKREAGITERQMIAARWAGGKRGKVAKRGECRAELERDGGGEGWN